MTSFLYNLKLVRMALICSLVAAYCTAVRAEPLISFSKSQPVEQVVSARFPPAVAGSPVGNQRLLAPPTRAQIASPAEGRSARVPGTTALALPKMESFTTAGAGLAIVVGLFLVCAWMLRRNGPKPTSPLPREAVAVLGRVPLAARNFAHLLQVGNKLVLVAITPDGVAPITEITDPVEVQRLRGLCLRNQKQSTTAEFHDVLEQLSKEPASGFLGNEVLGNQAAASYASQGRA